jgi:PIN domain
MQTLIFIDTNIMLDFYRIRKSETGLKFLEHIDQNHQSIITTSQVEVEFKKNRQKEILDFIDKIKPPDWSNLTPPPILSESKATQSIENAKNTIKVAQKKQKDRLQRALLKPTLYDPVYKTLQRLFRNDYEYNLNRSKKVRYAIRSKARKRFSLGYPPRKNADLSLGDAINWEWVVHCAENFNSNIVIVTRDSDYGVRNGDSIIINDWLIQEFRERVSKQRKLILTDKLSVAFKEAKIKVSKEEENEEADLVSNRGHILTTPPNPAMEEVKKIIQQKMQEINSLIPQLMMKRISETNLDFKQ